MKGGWESPILLQLLDAFSIRDTSSVQYIEEEEATMRKFYSRGLMSGAVLMLTMVLGLTVGNAWATPTINGAAIHLRVFNDCPVSVVTVTNNYPALICIDDTLVVCTGFANLHTWSFSSDGGATAAQFANGDMFTWSADMVISGTGQGEAGLRLSPWWSPDADGLFNVRTTDGEIACFGGRLPFFSFTAAFGLVYTKGDPIHLEMNYLPNGLSQANPATIEYKLVYHGVPYTSGPVAFDQGNTAEDPPHGLWGCLTPAYAGGAMKIFLSNGNFDTDQLQVCWTGIDFQIAKPTATVTRSWGGLKLLYR